VAKSVSHFQKALLQIGDHLIYLSLGDPAIFEAENAQDLILAGALASRAEDRDSIDLAVMGGLQDQALLKTYGQVKFVSFDPLGKRTEATILSGKDRSFNVTKGAPI
jgi:H+-transporting ATPase